MMTVSEAIKYMEETGQSVVTVKRSFDNPEFNGYFHLFRNNEILKLMPDTACADSVRNHYSIEEFTSLGSNHTFAPYEEPA